MKIAIESNQTDPAERRYNVFIIVWGIAALFHMARRDLFTDRIDHALLTISIFFLILKPSSIFRLVAFLAMLFSVTYRIMPNLSNHETFVVFANLTILHVLVYSCIQNRTFKIDKKRFFDTFAPLIRIELIIFYFYVVFHKLNLDFFNPSFSCATDFYNEQNSLKLLPVSNALYLASAYFTIIIELLIPALLCFKRTRSWGLLIGLLFHNLIAYNPINGFFDISSAVFATYVLFMENTFADKCYEIFYKAKAKIASVSRWNFSYSSLIVLILLFIGSIIFMQNIVYRINDYFRYILWTGFSIFIIFAFLSTFKMTGVERISFRALHPSLYLVPIIIFIHGLSPYLGLSTDYNFSMFSNLRTEGGKTNHLIVPASTQIFDYQKDLIEVISSTEPAIQLLADENKYVVLHAFNGMIRHFDPKRIEYIRDGKRFIYDKDIPNMQQGLPKTPSFLERKLLGFRPISRSEIQPCAH